VGDGCTVDGGEACWREDRIWCRSSAINISCVGYVRFTWRSRRPAAYAPVRWLRIGITRRLCLYAAGWWLLRLCFLPVASRSIPAVDLFCLCPTLRSEIACSRIVALRSGMRGTDVSPHRLDHAVSAGWHWRLNDVATLKTTLPRKNRYAGLALAYAFPAFVKWRVGDRHHWT